jgi:hypothetical protein
MTTTAINIRGIKCDHPKCGWNDMTVPFTDYDRWLNKPCPKCGHNLLTQKDYDLAKQLMGAGEILNTLNPNYLSKKGARLTFKFPHQK